MPRDKIPPERLARILAYNRKRAEEKRMASAGEAIAGLVRLLPLTIIRPLLTEQIREALRLFGVEV